MSCTIVEIKRQLKSVTDKIENINKLLDSCKEIKKHRFTVRVVQSDNSPSNAISNVNKTLSINPKKSPSVLRSPDLAVDKSLKLGGNRKTRRNNKKN
jgi:hypothetical protein